MINLPETAIIDIYNNTEWQIWYFKDIQHSNQIKNHYYIMIPLTDKSFILACLITSQIEKREKFYTNKVFKDCLVKLGTGQLSCLKLKSLIDCNQPLFISKEDFKQRAKDIRIIHSLIPKTLKSEIISKLKKSPIVKKIIKEAINEYI